MSKPRLVVAIYRLAAAVDLNTKTLNKLGETLMATVEDVEAAAHKVVGVINDSLPKIDDLLKDHADKIAALSAALASGADLDPAKLQAIVDELEGGAKALQTEHDAVVAALPAAG